MFGFLAYLENYCHKKYVGNESVGYKFWSHRSLFKLNAIQLELDLGFISHLLAQCQVNQHLLLGIRGIFCAEKSVICIG